MKVKDLIEMLLTLNPEAEIGLPTDLEPNRIINFYDGEGWVEENKKENEN